MLLNRFPQVSRFLLFLLALCVVFGAVTLIPHPYVRAAGNQPTWAFPFPEGTSVNIGPLGLHDHNFGSMLDDRTKKVFTFSNKLAADSLDIVLQPPAIGTSTIPTISVANGTVLAVWSACQLVLIDHGNGWWGMYLHMANIQVTSGNTVKTGTIIGYPTTNKPTLKACGSVESTAEHVHFVLLNGSGTKGTYVSLLGKVLCSYTVVEQNNDPTNIILQGLTQTKGQIFNVPACGVTPPGTVTEFPIPTSNSSPEGITSGPDGNLWFTEYASSKIGRITPSGTITEFSTPTTSTPDAITSGPDGNLWFTEYNLGKIGRITPSGTITEYALPTSNSLLYGITSGPDGNLWFTEDDSVSHIGKITPSGTITEYTIPTTIGQPWGITSGPDGNLWFTEYAYSKIGRITPTGSVTEYTLPNSYSYPEGITSGPDGNLWFTESYNTYQVGRITLSGTITEFPVNGRPTGITSGSDGNLWFTESYTTSQIGRITPSGTLTEFPIPTANSNPIGITRGPDGNLWFTEYDGNKIGKITP